MHYSLGNGRGERIDIHVSTLHRACCPKDVSSSSIAGASMGTGDAGAGGQGMKGCGSWWQSQWVPVGLPGDLAFDSRVPA